jgi:hypothetical protein
MVYRGHVVSGTIQLEKSVVLPEGTAVRAELAPTGMEECDLNAAPIEEKLRAIWADVSEEEWNRLPPDLTDCSAMNRP